MLADIEDTECNIKVILVGFWRSWDRSNDNGESLGLSPLKFVKYMKKKTYLIVLVERTNYTTCQTLSLIQSWLRDKQET